jgi:hypothetical protein
MTNHVKIKAAKSHFNMINLMKLRTHLAALANPLSPKPEVGFNMRDYFPSPITPRYIDHSPHQCGTVCCIGGHAARIGGCTTGSHASFAANWLGLTFSDAMVLFNGKFKARKEEEIGMLHDITLQEAIAALDHMIYHGEVPVAQMS